MRKVLLLAASLFLVTVSGWANTDDCYNQVVSTQAAQYQLEKNDINQPPMMLAGNNMVTEGQQPGADTSFGTQAARPSHNDFYRAALAEQVDEYKFQNESNWADPTLLAGNNMITSGSPGRRGDFYNRVLAANVGEFQAGNNSAGEGNLLLANMITGEQVVFGPEEEAKPEDFYNQALSANVSHYSIDNNAIAPTNTEFAEPQSLTVVPGSMASNQGRASDWYGNTVAIQAELNRRLKKSQAPNSF
jgi:hypothetical protein